MAKINKFLNLIISIIMIRISYAVICSILILSFSGCFTEMSEQVKDEDAGMNGSFEVTESGMPVNWLLYTSKTVPDGDFDIIIDTTEYQDGKQSLKFLVRECSPTGGWHSPGFSQQFDANPGEIYNVSFWVRNEGSEFSLKVGGVSAFEGEYETIVKSKETFESWQFYETNYTIPEKMESLRIEVNILQAGTFWIDDIKIDRIDD